MKIVFFGDSHAHALIRALAKSDQGEDMVSVDVRRIEDGRANLKEIPAALAEIYPADAIFCCLGGTEYNLLGLIESSEPFDFLLHPGDTVLPARKLIPRGLIKSALASRMRTALARMGDIRAQYDCSFTCVAPPPPFAKLENSVNLPQAFASHLEKGITPASVRRKLYDVQIELLQAHCRQEEIVFMSAPEEAMDESGYLRREFWNNDPTHGNVLYGHAVINHIRSLQFA